jgi:dolichol-phosphate mannosyltransferase
MGYSDFTLVIPTFNEEGTIGMLIHKVLAEYRGIKITVVDDGSTDSTKAIVEGLSLRNGSSVRFYDRKKLGRERGLANSMIDGLLISKTKYVIFMDGDMQHPVHALARIMSDLRDGSRIVVASRQKTYNPILYRHVISTVLTLMGTAILKAGGRATSSDIFSGYFGLETAYARRKVAQNRRRFVGEGYKFLFDLLKSTSAGEVDIREVPYTLRARKHGSSKATLRQGMALIKSFVT